MQFYVKQYSPEDYPILIEWLKNRNAYLPGKEEMPALGYVVYDEESPVCMGFIRMVEGGYGQFDGLTSNPQCPPEVRNEALDLLTNRIIFEAKEMGLKHLMAYSEDKNTLTRSTKHGFLLKNHVLIVKPL